MSSQFIVSLQKLGEGDRGALDELMPLVYEDVNHIAQSLMRQQGPGHTLQPTALVHEAFIKLFEHEEPRLVDRAHLVALMSRVMRQVLIDHARARCAAKRGGGEPGADWNVDIEMISDRRRQPLDLLELRRALDALAREYPHLAEVVDMHYFAGMTAEEVAASVGRSAHVIRHDLRFARAWLRRQLA